MLGSKYPNKGSLNLKESEEEDEIIGKKSVQLAKLIEQSKSIVFHTGAGISTSCGIPDFRGPRGVWTLEAKGETVDEGNKWEDTVPSYTHMSLVALEEAGKVDWLVSQNVDGLHARSGFPIDRLAELHGNVFAEHCPRCGHRRILESPTPLIGQKPTGNICNEANKRGSVCRGQMIDSVLDWEHDLPEPSFTNSVKISKKADLSIVLGSSLQIQPGTSRSILFIILTFILKQINFRLIRKRQLL